VLISPLDGKILHLKELGMIEQILFEEVISPEDFYKELTSFLKKNYDLDSRAMFTTQELEQVDSFIKNYFTTKINEAKVWLLRAYVMGRYLAHTDLTGNIFRLGNLSSLPKYVTDAAKQYGLSIEEAMALQQAVEESAVLMTNTTQSTIQTVREALVENVKTRGDGKKLIGKLRELCKDDVGEINRNWKRTAITEANYIFNNGFISMQEEGAYVVGLSMPDACGFCAAEINGQVFKVRKDIPPDYTTMKGAEYEKWAKVWETEIWVGKNNYGRSTSNRKRIDKHRGNKEDNLREKEHHEHSMPVCPAHPECHCRWVGIKPEFMWIDEHGQMRARVEDEDKWQEWYENTITN
jgi:hypothetical protein